MQCTKVLGRLALVSFFTLAAASTHAAAPTGDTMRRLGTDMGRAQRCAVAVSEILLFSQLARDLAQQGSDPSALQADFLAAAGQARDSDVADCKAAVARFDAALDEIYRLNGRQR